MAAVTSLKISPQKFEAIEGVEYPKSRGYLPSTYFAATPYLEEPILEEDYPRLKEKISFIIDCYSVLYEKFSTIESRLEYLETQNRELLAIIGRDEIGAIRIVTDDFEELSDTEMEDKIISYYKSHQTVYPSDIAFELNLDLRKVVKIVDKLIKEERVVVTP